MFRIGNGMAVSTENLVRVAMAGGSVVVDSSTSTDSLVRIAMAVKAKGVGHLTIAGNAKSTESIVRIAMAAPGHVTFDVSK